MKNTKYFSTIPRMLNFKIISASCHFQMENGSGEIIGE